MYEGAEELEPPAKKIKTEEIPGMYVLYIFQLCRQCSVIIHVC